MSEQEPGPSKNPYGQPTNPYGETPPADPYGQTPAPNPYGQAYGEESQGAPRTQPQQYGGPPAPGHDRRPGTVTAAGWITIVLSGLSAVLFGIIGLLFLVARDQIVTEMERVPEFQDANIDPDSVVGVMVAFMLGVVVWAIVSLVLGVFVLRRSNVARILLTISSVVVALGSLLLITSGISVVWLIAAIAVVVLLFVGGAGDWFNRTPSYGGPDQYGNQPGQPYGGYGDQSSGVPPTHGTPGQDNPGSTDYPPTDYPGRS